MCCPVSLRSFPTNSKRVRGVSRIGEPYIPSPPLGAVLHAEHQPSILGPAQVQHG